MKTNLTTSVLLTILVSMLVFACGSVDTFANNSSSVVYEDNEADPENIERIYSAVTVYLACGIELTEEDVIHALDWFARNAPQFIPEVDEASIRSAYDEGLVIWVQRDAFQFKDLPHGANGLYSSRNSLLGLKAYPYIYKTAVLHELTHMVEHRVTHEYCDEISCDGLSGKDLLMCRKHRCDYWDDIDSTMKDEFTQYVRSVRTTK